jgi:hypothetical protein
MRKNAVFLPFSELFDDTENPLSVTNHRKLAFIDANTFRRGLCCPYRHWDYFLKDVDTASIMFI